MMLCNIDIDQFSYIFHPLILYIQQKQKKTTF